MVTLTDVQIVYDNAIEAVREASLTLSKGIVALPGASGAGKSTTLQAISGVLYPEEGGQIALEGRPLTGMTPHRARRRRDDARGPAPVRPADRGGKPADGRLHAHSRRFRGRARASLRHVSAPDAEADNGFRLRAFASSIEGTAEHVRNLMTPLRQMFADALNDDLITVDPFTRIDMTALLKKSTKDSDYEVDPFTEQERDLIYRAARPDELQLVRFWLNSGLRPGELIAFK
jgi:energy-coupling factor transporter ATP-binding protein EcfA2